ncbi:MAG: Txe/YoeB family addiction module toxin [Symploca sp. SIO3E6]|nr:Txe/YoeB family addiction module toxin [Caldora sp. SIO3E6]
MSKKKKRNSSEEDFQNVTAYIPIFKQQFREDLGWWYRTEVKKAFKVIDLVEAILENPFMGIGKPEPLKYLDSNTWSRRIDLEHRLVYRVTQQRIYFLQARYHYD